MILRSIFAAWVFLWVFFPISLVHGASLSRPVLSVERDGTLLTLAWTSVQDATGYRLYYAPAENVTSFGSVDVGNITRRTIDYNGEAAFYVAIAAYNAQGQGPLSDLQPAVWFAQTSTTVNLMDGAYQQGAGVLDENDCITLSVLPEDPWVFGKATVFGTTAPSNNATVTLTYTRPDGDADTATASVANDGTYAHTFSDFDVAGQWTVSAQPSVCEQKAASGVITVRQPAGAAAVSFQDASQGPSQISTAMSEFNTTVQEFTLLPQEEIAYGKISEIQQVMAEVAAGLSELSTAASELNQVMDDLFMFPEIGEQLSQLNSTIQSPLSQMSATIQEMSGARTEADNATEWCRRFHMWKTCLQFIMEYMSFAASFAKSAAAYAAQQLDGAAQNAFNKLYDPIWTSTTGLTQQQITASRTAVTKLQDFGKKIKEVREGNISDAKELVVKEGVNWLINWIFANVITNCRQYEADVKGKLKVDFYTKKMVYMRIRYTFEGKMNLFFQTRTGGAGEQVRVEGPIYGSFGWRTGDFYPERTAMDIPGVWGIGLCVPRSPDYGNYRDFQIILNGEGHKNYLELKIDHVEYDKEEFEYSFISVLFSPYQVLPAVDFPKCNIPGGEWFVSRATSIAGDPEATFQLPLVVSGNDTKVEKTFVRFMDYIDESEFFGVLELEIKGKEGSL